MKHIQNSYIAVGERPPELLVDSNSHLEGNNQLIISFSVWYYFSFLFFSVQFSLCNRSQAHVKIKIKGKKNYNGYSCVRIRDKWPLNYVQDNFCEKQVKHQNIYQKMVRSTVYLQNLKVIISDKTVHMPSYSCESANFLWFLTWSKLDKGLSEI